MKKCIILIVLLFMVGILASCTEDKSSSNSMLFRCLFTNVSSFNYNILVEVSDSGLMKVSSGVLSKDADDKIIFESRKLRGKLSDFAFFDSVKKHAEKQLTKKELCKFQKCVADIRELDIDNESFEGWWDAFATIVIIDERKYAYIPSIPCEEFRELKKNIEELSPMELKSGWCDFTGLGLKKELPHGKKLLSVRIRDWYEGLFGQHKLHGMDERR